MLALLECNIVFSSEETKLVLLTQPLFILLIFCLEINSINDQVY